MCQRCSDFDARYPPLRALRAETDEVRRKIESGELFREVFGKEPA